MARVLGTVDGMKRFVEIQPSSYHGLNLCLGSTAEMLQQPATEIHEVIRYFGTRGQDLQHPLPQHPRTPGLRSRRCSRTKATWTWHAVMRTLKQVGYAGMVMPDHMPRHEDDPRQD